MTTQLDIAENRKHLNYSRMTYAKQIFYCICKK